MKKVLWSFLIMVLALGLFSAGGRAAVTGDATDSQGTKVQEKTAGQTKTNDNNNSDNNKTTEKKETNLKKQKTVFVAAGHQRRGISAHERYAPKGSGTKAKLTSGTAGVRTHIPEYKTNLAIAKALQKELEKRGYKVIMLRTTNNCPLSNQQRTKKANKSGADIHICIHCDSAGSGSSGPHTCVPASSKYVGKKIYNKSCKLANLVLSSTAKAVGKKSRGAIRSNYYTTINWAKIPTFILDCGYLSNPREDKQLNSKSYQKKLAKGIANGVDKYFNIKGN